MKNRMYGIGILAVVCAAGALLLHDHEPSAISLAILSVAYMAVANVLGVISQRRKAIEAEEERNSGRCLWYEGGKRCDQTFSVVYSKSSPTVLISRYTFCTKHLAEDAVIRQEKEDARIASWKND